MSKYKGIKKTESDFNDFGIKLIKGDIRMKINEKRALLPGTILKERYVLKKVSGKGSFGITYIGWDLLLESRVAIKEFFPINRVNRNAEKGEVNVYVFREEDYEESLHRYLEEGKRLSKLNQIEGIVSIRDFFYANHTAYIIMEYIEGISLKEYIGKNGPLEGNVVIDMIAPILDALEKVHANGIIHRDISPDNIMVTEENKLVLVDFGSARQVDVMDDRSLTVMIKRGYSSPEQYRSRGEQGAWSDVYAICATMYFMLTGKAPDEAIDRILDDELMSLVDIKEVLLPKKIKKAIMKGISLRYDERYQKISDLKEALQTTDGERGWPVRWEALTVGFLALLIFSVLVSRFFLDFSEKDNPQVMAMPGTGVSGAETVQLASYRMTSCEGKTKEQVLAQVRGISEEAVSLVWKSEYNSTVKKGRVIRQNIEPGTSYSTDRPVVLELIMSRGAKMVRVPDVRGKTLKQAKKILSQKELGYKVRRVAGREAENKVISQDVAPGKTCETGSKIILEVGEETTVSVPAQAPSVTKRPVSNKSTRNRDEYDGVIE